MRACVRSRVNACLLYRVRGCLECDLMCVCVRRACVRAFVVLRYRMFGRLACALSRVCVQRACVCSRVYDAAYVAVLHVHSRMCVNVLSAYVDVVIRVLAVPSIFHVSFSRLFACSGPLHQYKVVIIITRINTIDVYYKLCVKLT